MSREYKISGTFSTSESGTDINLHRSHCQVGAEESLGVEFSLGVPDQDPSDGNRRLATVIPDGRLGSQIKGSGGAVIPGHRRRKPGKEWAGQGVVSAWANAGLSPMRPTWSCRNICLASFSRFSVAAEHPETAYRPGPGRVVPDRDHLPNPCYIFAGQQQIDNHGRGPQAGQDHLLHAAAWTWIRG